MPIKDPDIYRIMEKIGDHYQNNVSNRFIRKALVVLDLQQSEWDRLDNLTAKSEYYKQQGFQFDELYEMVLAAAHFIHEARDEDAAQHQGDARRRAATDKERVLRDMAAQNFPVNLEILADLMNELYMKTTILDKAAHEKKRPVYERIPELKELGKLVPWVERTVASGRAPSGPGHCSSLCSTAPPPATASPPAVDQVVQLIELLQVHAGERDPQAALVDGDGSHAAVREERLAQILRFAPQETEAHEVPRVERQRLRCAVLFFRERMVFARS